MRACEAGRGEVVSMLLSRGAEPAAISSDSSATLMYASRGGEHRGADHLAATRLLLRDGRVPVNARNEDGETALWLACSDGFTERVRMLLLESRADPTIASRDGLTPRIAASRREKGEDCTRLLKVRAASMHAELALKG